MMKRSLPEQHRRQSNPFVPVYVGHNLPDSITLPTLLEHFEERNLWPDREVSTIIDTPGKRHGKLFFRDSDTAGCAAVVNGTKVGSFAIVVERWESRAKQPLSLAQPRSGPPQVVSVKLANCHHSLPAERLESMVHEIDPTANVVFHQTDGTKPNWAHINCASLASANDVVTRLHGSLVHRLPLSVKVVGGDKQGAAAGIPRPAPVFPPPQAAAVRPMSGVASSASVKVSYIPKSVTEEDILKLLARYSEVSVKVREAADQRFNYAYVNCTNSSVAEEVVQYLNGRSVGGNNVRAKIAEQSTASSVPPVGTPNQPKSFNKPREWEGDVETFSLKDIPPGSTEHNKVLSLMQQTMPAAKITKLERIQNKWLWNKYSQHCDEIKEKNGGVLIEKELFHGTGANDPQLIYRGEEGFDMRFCSNGMWGRGCYFAANASYSHNYAYSAATSSCSPRVGSRQMFLARVNIGEAHECPPDGSITMPPPKPSSKAAASSSMQFSVVRYDSVTGYTSNTRVYMVYDNRKAYPFYLVTYTC